MDDVAEKRKVCLPKNPTKKKVSIFIKLLPSLPILEVSSSLGGGRCDKILKMESWNPISNNLSYSSIKSEK